MPAFPRVAGEWTESIMSAREIDAWSDLDSLGWVWHDGAWVLFQSPGVQAGQMNPPENLSISGLTDNDATLNWTDPAQTITPTETQVRIVTTTAVWNIIAYGVTTYGWQALSPDTEHIAQVRYVQRTNGQVSAISPVASIAFTTLAAELGEPAPDPDGTVGDTTWPFPDPPGDDPIGTTNGCWTQLTFEILSQTQLTWIETGIPTPTPPAAYFELAGNATEFDFDTSALDPTHVYRMKWREACDTTGNGDADTFGTWQYGDPFLGAADWGAACAGITDSVSAGLDVLSDARYRYPKPCLLDDGQRLGFIEAVSSVEIGRGPAFGAYFRTVDDEFGAIANTSGGITMLAPLTTLLTDLGDLEDHTHWTQFQLPVGFTLVNGRETSIAVLSSGSVIFRLTESTTGVTPSVRVLLDTGPVWLTGTEITLDTDPHSLVVTWDDDGNKVLWVDGVSKDSDVTGDGWGTTMVPTVHCYAAMPPIGINLQQAGWDRILTDLEIKSLSPAVLGSGPTLLGSITATYKGPNVYDGSRYHYSASAAGVSVIDLINPASPSEVTTQAMTLTGIDYLEKVGNHLIGTDGSAGVIYIIDISTPTSPSLVHTDSSLVTTAYSPQASILDDDHFVIIRGSSANQVNLIDKSTPTALSIIDSQILLSSAITGTTIQAHPTQPRMMASSLTQGLTVVSYSTTTIGYESTNNVANYDTSARAGVVADERWLITQTYWDTYRVYELDDLGTHPTGIVDEITENDFYEPAYWLLYSNQWALGITDSSVIALNIQDPTDLAHGTVYPGGSGVGDSQFTANQNYLWSYGLDSPVLLAMSETTGVLQLVDFST